MARTAWTGSLNLNGGLIDCSGSTPERTTSPGAKYNDIRGEFRTVLELQSSLRKFFNFSSALDLYLSVNDVLASSDV